MTHSSQCQELPSRRPQDVRLYNGSVASRKESFPINCASRNAVWIFPKLIPPRFIGAPFIAETVRSHEMPDVISLPEGADVEVEFYGGAYSLRLDGERRRVYVRRFDYASYALDEDVRYAFLTLWREVELLESLAEVESAALRWLKAQPGGVDQGR